MATRKPKSTAQKAVSIADGFQNVVANLGTARDKNAHNTYAQTFLTSEAALAMYEVSWLAAAIVDYPAEDATRKWRFWRADAEQITAIEAVEKKLQLKKRVEEALIASRLYGGATIFINTENGRDAEKPLRENERIKSLVVMTKNTLQPVEIVRDINSEYFGAPEFFRLSTANGKMVTIHASRLVIFRGTPVPGDPGTISTDQWWGNSALKVTMDAVTSMDATMANMASLVFEAKVDVFRFKGFADLVSQNSPEIDAMLSRRLTTQAVMKGINGAVVIDSEDEYEQKSANFGGLPDVVAKFMDGVSGAARIPVTRLYGRAAVGLSGSGDGDERVYFDRVSKHQDNDISPAMGMLDDLIITQALGSRPPEIHYQWAPLRQQSETERADIFVKTANAARALAGTAAGEIIPLDALSDAVVNELTEQGVLPGLEKAIKEYGTLSEQGLPDDGDFDENV